MKNIKGVSEGQQQWDILPLQVSFNTEQEVPHNHHQRPADCL